MVSRLPRRRAGVATGQSSSLHGARPPLHQSRLQRRRAATMIGGRGVSASTPPSRRYMPMPSLISLAFKGCEPPRLIALVQVISASTPPSRRCHSPVALASRYEVTSMRFPRLGVMSSTATCGHYDRHSEGLGLYAAEQARRVGTVIASRCDVTSWPSRHSPSQVSSWSTRRNLRWRSATGASRSGSVTRCRPDRTPFHTRGRRG
jgi:hypothetical protein